MKYLFITDSKKHNKAEYPIVFMAVKSGDGFKRIIDVDKFFEDGGGISEIEEPFLDGMNGQFVTRPATVKLEVRMV